MITHEYDQGEGMQVASHVDHGTVIIETKHGPREFLVDLLRKFHGEPCETQSAMVGGDGYPRLKI